jgi:hypothetical protein
MVAEVRYFKQGDHDPGRNFAAPRDIFEYYAGLEGHLWPVVPAGRNAPVCWVNFPEPIGVCAFIPRNFLGHVTWKAPALASFRGDVKPATGRRTTLLQTCWPAGAAAGVYNVLTGLAPRWAAA